MKKKVSLTIRSAVFFLMMFSFVLIQSMDFLRKRKSVKFIPCIPQDVFTNKLLYMLNLQSIINFGATCKTYRSYCLFENICQIRPGVQVPSFKEINSNYFYSTCVLSYFAQKERKVKKKEDKKNIELLFEQLWQYHKNIRNAEFSSKKTRKQSKIAFYREYYSTSGQIRCGLNKQLKEVILNEKAFVLKTLMKNTSYNICEIFLGKELPEAINHLCSICIKEKNIFFLCEFIRPLKGNNKKTVIDQVFHHGNDDLLCALFKKGIIKPNEAYLYGVTSLHYAAYYNYVGLAVLLLRKGQNVQALDAYGDIPLYYAFCNNSREMINLIFRCYDYNDFQSLLLYYMQQYHNSLKETSKR